MSCPLHPEPTVNRPSSMTGAVPRQAAAGSAALWQSLIAALVLVVATGCGSEAADERQHPGSVARSAPQVASLVEVNAIRAGATAAPDPEALFNWAEQTYHGLFPAPATTAWAMGYTYRYYPATATYLGIKDQEVALLGPVTGHVVKVVGTLDDFGCRMFPDTCVTTPLSPRNRPFSPRGRALIGADGAVYVLGDVALAAGQGTPVVGSTARRLVGLEGVATLAGWAGASGLAVTPQGEVLAWGQIDPSYGGGAHQWDPAVIPARKIAASSRVAQLADFGGQALVYLRDDGTVWVVGVKTPVPNKTLYQLQVEGLNHVVALSTGLADDAGLFAIRKDGSVWRLRQKPYALGYEVHRQMVELSGVVQIDCAQQCVALTRQGRVYTWQDISLAHQDVHLLPDMGDVVSVAIGSPGGDASQASALAVTRGGGLWAWGVGRRGGWGRAAVDLSPTPTRIADDAVGISCAGESLDARGMVVLKDGSVWVWGETIRLGGFQSTRNPVYVKVEGLTARRCEPLR